MSPSARIAACTAGRAATRATKAAMLGHLVNPIPVGGLLRDTELPNPGGFNIPPASVPAGTRPTDGGRLFPPPGGGIVTGDPRK